jgi:enoyl-CoA hydratase/carnithine racemase
MWDALPVHIAMAEQDPAVRVIILTGAGRKAFSAGADISEFGSARSGDEARRYDEINDRAFMSVVHCEKPTIAVVHGYCFGGGCELAICCDMRVAADDAIFSIPAARLSLGYNARWIRPMLSVMTPVKAKEMLFTARRYKADEALTMGILNSVAAKEALEEEATRLAGEIAANAPLTIRAAKAAIDDMVAKPESADMGKLDRLAAACYTSEDYVEGQRAFLEKRKPRFTGK